MGFKSSSDQKSGQSTSYKSINRPHPEYAKATAGLGIFVGLSLFHSFGTDLEICKLKVLISLLDGSAPFSVLPLPESEEGTVMAQTYQSSIKSHQETRFSIFISSTVSDSSSLLCKHFF